jgi:hypothetical protein
LAKRKRLKKSSVTAKQEELSCIEKGHIKALNRTAFSLLLSFALLFSLIFASD